uniref:Uncharacterized protein n=1 Tax=Alexandrium monilatum TaxID=311494 RepID=A0A7S4VMJ8_9DINO
MLWSSPSRSLGERSRWSRPTAPSRTAKATPWATGECVVEHIHPLQIAFHQRNVADGFRAQLDMPKSARLSAVEAFVKEAKLMDGVQPPTGGCGTTLGPIRDCSYDSLFCCCGARHQGVVASDLDARA